MISIITPCLNRAGFVGQAVESVMRQDYPDVEHIVMDGGSTDGTLDQLARYPHLRVFSQPDAGIYDALNKGLRRARGDVIGFLNTDDLYEPDIFATVARTFAEAPDVDAVVGGASIVHERTPGEWVVHSVFPGVPPDALLFRTTQGAPIFNAWFFRKTLLDELKDFDTRYRYVADRDLLIRMALQNKPYASVPLLFYRYRMHPGSYTLSGEDSGEAAYMFESRILAERYLTRSSLPRAAIDCVRTWHSQITIEHMLTARRRNAYHRVARYGLIGLRYNPGRWPTILGKTVLDRLFRS